MNSKPSSPSQQARVEKQKAASVEGAKAMAEKAASDTAVRKNMARLRELRLAREAEEAAKPPVEAAPRKRATSAKTKAAAAAKGAAKPPLSDWLATQKDSGRGT